MVFQMAIDVGNKKSWVNGLGLVLLAEIGGFPGEHKEGQYQPMHIISSYGYNLIFFFRI